MNGLGRIRSRFLRWSIYMAEFMLVLVAIAAVGSLFASAQSSSSLNLNVTSSCNPYNGTFSEGRGPGENSAMINGTVSITGNSYSGSITFNGTAKIILYGSSGQEYTSYATLNRYDRLAQFNPNTIQYPGQNAATFIATVVYPTSWKASECTSYVTINAVDPSTGQILGTGNSSGTGYTTSSGSFLGGDYITRYIVTLPTIPDSFFGIPLDFGGSPTQNGYGFPIVTGGQIFQELFYVSIIGLIGAAMLSAILSAFGNIGGEGGKSSMFYTILTGSVFGLFAIIIMLPLYNIFAVMVNGLSYWILNPNMPTFNGASVTTSDLMSRGFSVINAQGILSNGLWSIITGSFGAGLNVIAMFVLWLMIQLIVPLVGVARIFLMVAFVAIGPIIVILNIIPLTKHLSETLISAIVGLMVAGPVSATFIALADKIITPGAEPYGNLLVPGNGVMTFIIVAAGILGAAFIPMVLAPITGFFFQTLSQVGMGTAMTAATIATAGAGGAGVGFVQGMSGGLQAATSMGKTGLSKLGMGLSQGMKGVAVVTPDVAKNMGLMMIGGVAGLAGASQAAKHIGILGGGHTSFADIGAKAKGNVAAGNIATQLSGIHQNLFGMMTTPLPANANWGALVNAGGKAFSAPKIDPDSVANDISAAMPDNITSPAKQLSQKWKALTRDQAWNELEAHNIIPKGIDKNNPYQSKPIDSFINSMKQNISNLNPNNVEDAKQIVRLKNSMDIAQHLGKVPSADELNKMLS